MSTGGGGNGTADTPSTRDIDKCSSLNENGHRSPDRPKGAIAVRTHLCGPSVAAFVPCFAGGIRQERAAGCVAGVPCVSTEGISHAYPGSRSHACVRSPCRGEIDAARGRRLGVPVAADGTPGGRQGSGSRHNPRTEEQSMAPCRDAFARREAYPSSVAVRGGAWACSSHSTGANGERPSTASFADATASICGPSAR